MRKKGKKNVKETNVERNASVLPRGTAENDKLSPTNVNKSSQTPTTIKQ